MPVITLATDFGISDPYAGIMKGVILSIAPGVSIIDLSHSIEARDIAGAAYLIDSSYRYFPEKSVHVLVVDPGVGSDRAIIAAAVDGHCFLAPDNGVMTKILARNRVETLVTVENSEHFRHPVSRTFHGRDVFAPVAAHMAGGTSLSSLGSPVSTADLVMLSLPEPHINDAGELEGEVVTIDHFGNLITNLDEKRLTQFSTLWGPGNLWVHTGGNCINGLSDAYQAVRPGQLLAILGSRGYLEISVNAGDARAHCGVGKGAPVRLRKSG